MVTSPCVPKKRISLRSGEAYEQVQELNEGKSVTDSMNLLTLRKNSSLGRDHDQAYIYRGIN